MVSRLPRARSCRGQQDVILPHVGTRALPDPMRTWLQRLLLLAYGTARRSGIPESRLTSAAYETSYSIYKRFVEAPYVPGLRRYVSPGSTVVDVGANVGFFVRYFSEWVGSAGRVIAIEPEAHNFQRLCHLVRARNLGRSVETIQAIASDAPGHRRLAVDPRHPGGHHVAADGVWVRSVTVDDLLRSRGWPSVSLIKVDVQGAELQVLIGAAEAIARFAPTLLVELDEIALRMQETSAEQVLDFLWKRGYLAHLPSARRRPAAVDRSALLSRCADGRYVDVLFLQHPRR